jgi:hypothetical protein
MLDNQVSGLSRCPLRQGQGRAQERADISNRQSRQDFGLVTLKKRRIVGVLCGPIHFGLGDEPCCHDREDDLGFPGQKFACLEFIPPILGFGNLIAAPKEVPLRFAPGEQARGVLGDALPISLPGCLLAHSAITTTAFPVYRM